MGKSKKAAAATEQVVEPITYSGSTKPGNYTIIPVAEIVESKTNPRKSFGHLNQLADSIEAHGVLEPVLVRPLELLLEDVKYELIAGARRFRATKIAGLSVIPAIVREMTDRQALEIQVVENDQREDISPMDQARGYKALLAEGYDVPGLALKIGRDESYVYQRLKLNDLIEVWQDKLASDEINMSQAILLARLTPENQDDADKEWGNSFNLLPPAAELKAAIYKSYHRDLDKAPFPKDDENLLIMVGSCNLCSKRTGFNPGLFPDVKAKDECTDKVCYEDKQEAYIQLQVKVAEQKATSSKVLKISTQYYHPSSGILNSSGWRELTPKAAKALPGAKVATAVLVDGKTPGRICQVEVVNERAKVSGPTDQEKAENRKREDLRVLHSTVVDTILNRIFEEHILLEPCYLRRVVQFIFDHLGSDLRKAIAKRHGWTKPEKVDAYADWVSDMAEGYIADLGVSGIHQLLVEMMLVGKIPVHAWAPLEVNEKIVEVAREYGVDVDEVADRLKPEKEDAKPVKTKAGKKPGKAVQECRVCGCTEDDCSECIKETGKPCHWVEPDLCSACDDQVKAIEKQLSKPVKKKTLKVVARG